MKNLSQHTSVITFLHDSQSLKLSDRTDIYPEFNDEKEINYYIFGPKTESYFKNGKEIQYTRTARIDKKEEVSVIAQKLISIKDSYLKHRSHVDNISKVFPIVKEEVLVITQKLISIKDSYLKHRSHVDNISKVFPIVKEPFQGTYIELDFSENVTIKPKFEV